MPNFLLYRIKAYLLGDKTRIEWIVDNEFNNDRYDIEKSKNGIDFRFLKAVSSRGNSTEERTYIDYDTQTSNGRTYYRVRQIDHDGSESISPIVFV